jgi:hypothetical protein
MGEGYWRMGEGGPVRQGFAMQTPLPCTPQEPPHALTRRRGRRHVRHPLADGIELGPGHGAGRAGHGPQHGVGCMHMWMWRTWCLLCAGGWVGGWVGGCILMW